MKKSYISFKNKNIDIVRIIFVLLFFSQQIKATTDEILDDCTGSYIYNSLTYKCSICYDNASPNDNNVCECDSGYEFNYSTQECECIYAVGAICQTDDFYVKYQEDGNPTAVFQLTCEDNAYPSESYPWCTPCDHYSQEYNESSESCVCTDTSTYTSAGNSCVLNSAITKLSNSDDFDQSFSDLKYQDLPDSQQKSYTSQYFTDNYIYHSIGCGIYENIQSCSILANMCVLALYDMSNEACQLQNKLQGEDNVYTLYISQSSRIDRSNRAQFDVTFDEAEDDFPNTVNSLRFYLAIFGTDGLLKSFQQLNDEFLFCSHTTDDLANMVKFGIDFENKCSIDISSYIDLSTPVFYELYLQNDENDYYRVPVLVDNYRDSNGDQVNQSSDKGDWQYISRFMLVDNLGSITSTGGDPKILRIAKDIRLLIQLTDTSIFIPTLQIEYAERVITDGIVEDSKVDISYKTEYYSDESSFWVFAIVFLCIWLVVIFGVTFLRVRLWSKFNPRQLVTRGEGNFYLQALGNTMGIFLDTLSQGMFYYLLIMTGYWFVTYKMQSVPYLLIPSKDQYYDEFYKPFDVMFFLMFSFNMISIVYTIYKQTSIDIFFVDWEKPIEYKEKEDRDRGISVWRTLFIANELNEMSIERVLAIELNLMLMGFIFSGFGFEDYARETPDFNKDIENVERNYVLKFFLVSFVFLLIGLIEKLLRRAIELFSPYKIKDFLDLCYVANISILFFDGDLHGYYFHGRNTNQSEGNSYWLQQLIIGQDKYGKSLSQSPNRTNILNQPIIPVQIYEMLLPTQFRQYYEQQFDIQKQMDKQFGKDKNKFAPNNKPKAIKSTSQSRFLGQDNQEPQEQSLAQENEIQIDEKENKKKNKQPEGVFSEEDKMLEGNKRKINKYLKYKIEQSAQLPENQAIKDKGYIHRLFGYPEDEPETLHQVQRGQIGLNTQHRSINNTQQNFDMNNNNEYNQQLNTGNNLNRSRNYPGQNNQFQSNYNNNNYNSQMMNEDDDQQNFDGDFSDGEENSNSYWPIFYRDHDLSSLSLFFSGIEFKLLIFNIYCYNFFDILFDSTLISIVATFILDKILTYKRAQWGEDNLSKKTLIKADQFSDIPTDCEEDEYYNSVLMECDECPYDTNQMPNDNKNSCICKYDSTDQFYKVYASEVIGYFYQDATDGGGVNICTAIACAGSDCFCDDNDDLSVLPLFEQNGQAITSAFECLVCADNAYNDDDNHRCIPCPDDNQIYNSDQKQCLCSGNTNYFTNQQGTYCVDKTVLPDNFQENNIPNSDSAYQNYYYYQSAALCYEENDPQYCNILGNICIMQMFYASTSNSEGLACALIKENTDGTQLSPYHDGQQPWIFYTGTQDEIEQDERYGNVMIVNENTKSEDETYYLDYYIAVYDLEGHLEDFRQLGTEFMICPSSVADGYSARAFGTDFTNNCEISLQTYIDSQDMKFYEVFIKDYSGTYYEVPVLVRNLLDSSQDTPNQDDSSTNKQFVRRFFIVDNITERTGNNYTDYTSLASQSIKYASTIYFKITMQPNDELIYIPYIDITYSDIDIESDLTISNTTTPIIFETEYTYNSDSFWPTATAFFIIFLIFGLLYALIKCYMYTKLNPQTNPQEPYCLYMCIHYMCIILDVLADTFFYYLLIFTGYWFVFFKLQERSFVLLPSEDDPDQKSEYYTPFNTLFWFMYVFKTIGMIHLVYIQQNIEIFFIDWEKLKERILQTDKHKQLQQYQNQPGRNTGGSFQQQFFQSQQQRPNIASQQNQSQQKQQDPGISVWRSLFVANEFNEIQIERTVEIEWSLFFLGFFLSGIKLENLAASTPDFTIDDDKVENLDNNYVLTFFLGAFIFLMIGFVQLFLRKLLIIWWPLHIQDFNDLCSVGNISILVFDSILHGYYMHGKAPIGVSEGNSQWLDEALQKEARANASRGFLKGQALQSFEVIVSQDFKKQYNEIFTQSLEEFNKEANQKGQVPQNTRNKFIDVGTPIYDAPKYQELENRKNYLTNFLKENLELIEENSANHVIPKSIFIRLFNWFDIENILGKAKGSLPVFYEDPEYSIQKIMYLGQEVNLLLFNIITFCMFNKVFDSTLKSIFLTYLVDSLFLKIRAFFGKRTLAKKSLIDEVFLN
ncbi:hypothetical protein PPERSA_06985 [Pseudocohnilembus persalinus]|uniref:Insulin-like growth factor binding protein, N-terminal n=1 Tax=Pseudocohnilembus persalinus TaxID=266149 RepID=A0A0V0QZ78_PSEPJ|nr:hypothetical protein PPERSA_06985 [Pseudocohnilembus persalinus]|eukprot:KRX07370.1 hypothetical protein PPERSA_06985 [Pseudocohnilembus persalinus]